jgi:hypothetical protein
MTSQPLLPIRQPPKTLEYAPADDAPPWLIEDWQGLAAAFDLHAHEVLAWHVALAGQGRPWLVIRRRFKIAPLWGEGYSPDDLKVWSWAELASSLGVPEAHLKTDLDAAREFWKKARMTSALSRQPATSTLASCVSPPEVVAAKPPDGLPQFSIHQDFTDAQIAATLTPFRFQSIRSASDRLYVANRILELRKLLEDKQTRESARTLIVMELNMASHESALQAHKYRLECLQKSGEISKDQSTEILKLGEAITATEKALTLLSTTYRAAAADLGSDEAEAGEQRRVAIGTISHLTEAHRQYYADGSRVLIDGMFSADEVVWLTTPHTIRPAQYRPDVVLRVREACIPENLWGKDYTPTVIQREACRRLLKLTQLLTEEIPPPDIPEIDADNSAAEEDPDSAPLAAPAPDAPCLVTDDYTPPEPRPEEPCMGIG